MNGILSSLQQHVISFFIQLRVIDKQMSLPTNQYFLLREGQRRLLYIGHTHQPFEFFFLHLIQIISTSKLYIHLGIF